MLKPLSILRQIIRVNWKNISTKYCRDVDYYILKYTGRGMTSTEIYDSLKKIVENKAEKGGSKSWRLN